MATTLEKIKTLLSMGKKGNTYKVKMYAEAVLDDGRVIATEDEDMSVGSEVYEINDDGEAFPLESGTYTLDNGEKLVIDDSSTIASLGEEEVVEEETVEEEVEMNEEVVEEVSDASVVDEVAEKINSATPDEVTEEISKQIAQEVVDHLAGKVEDAIDEVEGEVEEMEEDKKTEMSSELSRLKEENDNLKNQIEQLEEEPAVQKFSHNPNEVVEKKTLLSKDEVLKMTTSERAKYMIYNNITRI